MRFIDPKRAQSIVPIVHPQKKLEVAESVWSEEQIKIFNLKRYTETEIDYEDIPWLIDAISELYASYKKVE